MPSGPRGLWLAIVLLMCFCALPTFGQTGEQVELPNVENTYWVTAFVDVDRPDDPDAQRLLALLDHPDVQRATQATRNNVFGNDSEAYQTKFAQYVGDNLPIVLVQTPKGKVVYKASGQDIPHSPEPLLTALQPSAGRVPPVVEYLSERFRRCPDKPEPKPEPKPAPKPVPIPDTRPKEPAVPWWLFAVMAVLGLGVGGLYAWRKSRG